MCHVMLHFGIPQWLTQLHTSGEWHMGEWRNLHRDLEIWPSNYNMQVNAEHFRIVLKSSDKAWSSTNIQRKLNIGHSSQNPPQMFQNTTNILVTLNRMERIRLSAFTCWFPSKVGAISFWLVYPKDHCLLSYAIRKSNPRLCWSLKCTSMLICYNMLCSWLTVDNVATHKQILFDVMR